jgi:hypothetical protein
VTTFGESLGLKKIKNLKLFKIIKFWITPRLKNNFGTKFLYPPTTVTAISNTPPTFWQFTFTGL